MKQQLELWAPQNEASQPFALWRTLDQTQRQSIAHMLGVLIQKAVQQPPRQLPPQPQEDDK